MVKKYHHYQILFYALVLLIPVLKGCAFIPVNVDVNKLEPDISYPRGSLASQFKVKFESLVDRRSNKGRLGVVRNKLMMVTSSVSVAGDMEGLFNRMVKQNFAAAGFGEGPSNLTIKPELIEASTDLPGPDHVFVRIKLAISVLDSSSGIPIHRQIIKGYEVTPVTQISNMAWEEAFIGASNQVSDQIYEMAMKVRLAKNNSSPPSPQPVVQQPSVKEQVVAGGTGFLFGSKDYVITNWHVVKGANSIVAKFTDGQTVKAIVVAKDSKNDIAILKLANTSPLSATPIKLGDSSSARMGEKIFTIGYPASKIMGEKPKYSEGVINSMTGLKDDPAFFQVSVPVQPGNSGGPLFNEHGEVIGITTSSLSLLAMDAMGAIPQNVNYAIKSSFVKNLLSTIPELMLSNTNILVVPKESDDSLPNFIEQVSKNIVLIEAKE